MCALKQCSDLVSVKLVVGVRFGSFHLVTLAAEVNRDWLRALNTKTNQYSTAFCLFFFSSSLYSYMLL